MVEVYEREEKSWRGLFSEFLCICSLSVRSSLLGSCFLRRHAAQITAPSYYKEKTRACSWKRLFQPTMNDVCGEYPPFKELLIAPNGHPLSLEF